MEFKIVEITPEEFREMCKKRILQNGLYKSIEEELDEIVEISRRYGYLQFSETAERSNTILELLSISDEQNKSATPIERYHNDWRCGNCNREINRMDLFCSKCGREINWKEIRRKNAERSEKTKA